MVKDTIRKTSKKKSRTRAGLASVTAVLPDGRYVDLFGDAAEMVGRSVETPPDWRELAEAVTVILTSDATPRSLFNPVSDFVHEHGSAVWAKLLLTPIIMERVLMEASLKDTDEPKVVDHGAN